MLKQVLIVAGSTGVGKTEFVSKLAARCRAEIINADIGQMYQPLTIGTAKPDWQNELIAHHLFDVICEPKDFTIVQFRIAVSRLIKEIWSRGNMPIIVGGSTLYIKSLFFAPADLPSIENQRQCEKNQMAVKDDLWQQLFQIDPIRANQLHPNDYYRLQRALHIWKTSGILPSQCAPTYQPVATNMTLLILDRDRSELYAKIDERVYVMMKAGWVAEVAGLAPEWHDFLRRKKIIGYELLLDHLDQKIKDYDLCIQLIQQRVRNYAKRQQTFWRGLCRELDHYDTMRQKIFEINLTLLDVDLYIKQLVVKLKLD